jgi:ABC-type dipeptide/oligopeptide/nickel transport system ATPase subunit
MRTGQPGHAGHRLGLTRLLDPTDGSIRFDARELAPVSARGFAADADRANIQMVFQDAGESINPRFTAADAIADPLRRLREPNAR